MLVKSVPFFYFIPLTISSLKNEITLKSNKNQLKTKRWSTLKNAIDYFDTFISTINENDCFSHLILHGKSD
jgi:hypothetical protein